LGNPKKKEIEMAQVAEDIFTHSPAARIATPLFAGIVGPSGTGKTYSALRLATGMQRITGGEIFGIDTESNRMLHYAPLPGEKADPTKGKFAFQHVKLEAPYGSLRYLNAIRYCASKGAKNIVIDSGSHEHDGVGGVLEQHQAEAEKMAKETGRSLDAVKMSAWGVPKANRRKLINSLLTELSVNCIFCFRAKPKLKIATKKEKADGADPVTPLGFCAIAGEEFIYEMMIKFVLLPGARGVPTWQSEFQGEQEMMKIPEQFLHVFEEARPLSEDIGQQLAEWAAGGDTKAPSDEECAKGCAAAKGASTLIELEAVIASFRGKPWTKAQRKNLTAAVDARKTDLSKAS
jgi:ABC-type oligopeptide transport system ATPase subunit